ncbi:MAG: DNA polymerase domain-containing protein [Thermoplasmata archaeon]
MRGWLIDIYPEHRTNSMVYWIRTQRGVHRVVDRTFRPTIFVRGEPDRLDELERALPILGAVSSSRRVRKRTWLDEEERELLEVTIRDYSKVEEVAHTIDNRGRYRDYQLYNVDLRFSQRYFVEKGIFPMGLLELRPEPRMLDDPYEMDYELPPLTSAELAVRTEAKRGIPTFEDRLVSARVGAHELDGDEESVLRGIEELLEEEDPDIVYTDGGDAFSIPYIYHRAGRLGMSCLRLGRDIGDTRTDRRGRSYFTYGQIKYKPPSYKLLGRIHIDRTSSFMYAESGLEGLIDLSRISEVPLQELSRLSPGSAISAMEVNQALRDGCVIMWKKNLPEEFKTAEELVFADRGGFIYEPRVGIHDRVLEVDFTSLYPNIMVRFNISPETLQCSCCPDPRRRVPVLGYGICDRRLGLIPRVLKPVVERRMRLKRLAREGSERAELYKRRANILKWLLVTCLDGATEVPFALDGRFDARPVEDIVEQVSGTHTGELAIDGDLRLFGVDERLRPAVKTAARAFRFPAPQTMVELVTTRGRTVLTADHPCYIFGTRGLELRRAEHLAQGDRLPVLLPLYSGRAKGECTLGSCAVKSVRRVRPSSDYVYCFAVSEPLHGFALADGVLTHNCFGYMGYRNARFGRIECHEAINAYGREILLQASEMAEAHGFEILHGIVDSLWLKGDGDPERFCEHVSGHIGIPLEPEGMYKWIVFLPDRTRGVGALNRYYGVFEDGALKVRGIELRRHDTPRIVREMQGEMLSVLSKADDSQQFLALLPSAIEAARGYVDAVRSGNVPLEKLLISRKTSQTLGEYKQLNDSVAALRQLDERGFEVNAGEPVRYIVVDRRNRDHRKRVKVDSFIRGDEAYDAEFYVDLLLRAVEGLLLPFGLSRERLSGILVGSENPAERTFRSLCYKPY